MHQTSQISMHQLAKARKRPLHTHCRYLLEKAGQAVNDGTIGAPELMQWTLESKQSKMSEESNHNLQHVVAMLQDKPSLVITLLEPTDLSSEQEHILQQIHSEDDPTQAGILLLKLLKQRMDHLVDTSNQS